MRFEFLEQNSREFDVIIALDRYKHMETQNFLRKCCKNGALYHFNISGSIEKRYLKKHFTGQLDQCIEIIENHNNIKSLFRKIN